MDILTGYCNTQLFFSNRFHSVVFTVINLMEYLCVLDSPLQLSVCAGNTHTAEATKHSLAIGLI